MLDLFRAEALREFPNRLFRRRILSCKKINNYFFNSGPEGLLRP